MGHFVLKHSVCSSFSIVVVVVVVVVVARLQCWFVIAEKTRLAHFRCQIERVINDKFVQTMCSQTGRRSSLLHPQRGICRSYADSCDPDVPGSLCNI